MNWFDILKKDPWEHRPVDSIMVDNQECCEQARQYIIENVYERDIQAWIDSDTNEAPDEYKISPKERLPRMVLGEGVGQANRRYAIEMQIKKVEKLNCRQLREHILRQNKGGGKRPTAMNEAYRQWDACVRGSWMDTDVEGPGKGTLAEFRDKWL